MKNAIAEIGYYVDKIPQETYDKEGLMLLVSEQFYDSIVGELKDYKTSIHDIFDNSVNSFTFEGIKVQPFSLVNGSNVYVSHGKYLEDFIINTTKLN
jgi:hypothetical protein